MKLVVGLTAETLHAIMYIDSQIIIFQLNAREGKMKKWFFVKVMYQNEFSADTLVDYISEEEIESILPNLFYLSDEYGIQIYELTISGEKVERNDLSQKIVATRNENIVWWHKDKESNFDY